MQNVMCVLAHFDINIIIFEKFVTFLFCTRPIMQSYIMGLIV